jgi:hypothetical protein
MLPASYGLVGRDFDGTLVVSEETHSTRFWFLRLHIARRCDILRHLTMWIEGMASSFEKSKLVNYFP